MEMAVRHVADRHTSDNLMRVYVEPAFKKKRDALLEKIYEVLWPFQRSHAITYNPRSVACTSKDDPESYRQKASKFGSPCEGFLLAAEAMDLAKSYHDVSSALRSTRCYCLLPYRRNYHKLKNFG